MNERFKELRIALNLTQQEFGDKLGLLKSAISKIESNKQNVTEQLILIVCREFNVSEEWLRNGTGEMFIEKDRFQIVSEFAAGVVKNPDSIQAKLIESLAKLDEKDWIELEKLFDKMMEKNKNN